MSWTTEHYRATGPATLAQELYDTGLLFMVNSAVLHHHGLALGVQVEHGKVVGLTLHETGDPNGIWFNEQSTEEAREKLAAAGLLRRR